MSEPAAPVITGSIAGSLVLAADDPDDLGRFYGALLNVEPQPGLSSRHWRVSWPVGGWLDVYAPSRSRPQPRQPRQSGRLALCMQRKADAAGPLAVLHAWIATALELGNTTAKPSSNCSGAIPAKALPFHPHSVAEWAANHRTML